MARLEFELQLTTTDGRTARHITLAGDAREAVRSCLAAAGLASALGIDVETITVTDHAAGLVIYASR